MILSTTTFNRMAYNTQQNMALHSTVRAVQLTVGGIFDVLPDHAFQKLPEIWLKATPEVPAQTF
jgi:hypothetical protein